MKCSVFTENLDKFISDDMPQILINEMKNHMDICEECRELYESEILLHEAIHKVVDIDDHLFKSNKESIMSKIDKNKYKNNKCSHHAIYKNLFRFGIPISAAAIFMLLINPTSKLGVLEDNVAINNIKDKSDVVDNIIDKRKNIKENIKDNLSNVSSFNGKNSNKSNPSNSENKIDISNKLSLNNTNDKFVDEKINRTDREDSLVKNNNKSENKIISLTDETEKDENRKSSIEKITSESIFKKVPIKVNKKNILNDAEKLDIDWKTSPDKSFSFAMKSKKDNDNGKIYIKNEKQDEIYTFQLKQENNNIYPKNAKWDNDKNLFVVCNSESDKKVLGEELYFINTNTGNAFKLYNTSKEDKTIVDVKRQGNNIKLKIRISNHDNNGIIRTEEHIIHDVPTELESSD